MSQDERIEQLKRTLEEERAYSSVLEISIQMEVEKRLNEATKEAYQQGYEEGQQSKHALQGKEAASNFTKELERTLENEIPALISSAIPEKYLGVVKADMFRPQLSTRFDHDPNTMHCNTSATITIPSTVIRLGYNFVEDRSV